MTLSNYLLIIGVFFASIIGFGFMTLGLMVIFRMLALSMQRARANVQVPPELKKADAVARFVPTDDDDEDVFDMNQDDELQALEAARRERAKLQGGK